MRDNKFLAIMIAYLLVMVVGMLLFARGCTTPPPEVKPAPVKLNSFTIHHGGQCYHAFVSAASIAVFPIECEVEPL